MRFSAFVSSTYEDLKAHRRYVIEELRRAGFYVDPMENWTAAADEPEALFTQRLEGCDLCVLLIAFRRGHVPEVEGRSITQMEYDEAVRRKIPVLVFLLEEDALCQPKFYELESDPEVRVWRDSFGEKNVIGFFNHEPTSIEIGPALTRWAADRADEPAPSNPLNYLKLLRNQTSHINIRGLHVGSGKASRFPLEDLYIRLATTTPGGMERSAKGTEELRGPRNTELEHALKHPRLLVVGAPGAGKTTFLQRVAQVTSRSRLGHPDDEVLSLFASSDGAPRGTPKEPQGETPSIPFPFFLRVSDFCEHREAAHGDKGAPTVSTSPAWLAHCLAARASEAELDLDERFIRKKLKDGPAILLLDGLDEAPTRDEREKVCVLIEKVAETYENCRIVVSSRPGALRDESVLPSFATARISDLDDQAVEHFLSLWSRAVFQDNPSEAKQHLKGLLVPIRERPEIRLMARTPVMLTALAVVHWHEKRLPEERADLYNSILTWLARARKSMQGRPNPERCLVLLQELALEMQNHPDGRQVQVTRRWAAEKLEPRFSGKSQRERVDSGEQFLAREEVDSGIIGGRGLRSNEVRFWHLTFQEFLASRAISALAEKEQQQLLLDGGKLYRPEWRESMLLLGGILHRQGEAKLDGLIEAALTDLGEQASLSDQARFLGLFGEMVQMLDRFDYRPAPDGYRKVERSVEAIFDRDRSDEVAIQDRIAAAEVLGQSGDLRFTIRNAPGNWVAIPAGSFLMGAQTEDDSKPNYGQDAYEDESPVFRVKLSEFEMARYPVTVSEFSRFVDSGGYETEAYWRQGGFGDWERPDDWEQQRAHGNRPVTGVSWFEAAAFAVWTGAQLPTEAQWERAARGTEGRRFPWGNAEPNVELLNFDESNVGAPTPVGVYPKGATPKDICDLAGNVWEWCADWFGDYEEEDQVDPPGPPDGTTRVLRGGAWDVIGRDCRGSYRLLSTPVGRLYNVGFRLVRVSQAARTKKRKS